MSKALGVAKNTLYRISLTRSGTLPYSSRSGKQAVLILPLSEVENSTPAIEDQKGATPEEDLADSADVEVHGCSLIVAQDIKLDRSLIAELLEEGEHRTGIPNVHTIDLLENITILQTDFLIKA